MKGVNEHRVYSKGTQNVQDINREKAFTGAEMTTVQAKSPQKQPLLFKNTRGDLSAAIFVEEVRLDGRNVSVTGWATQNCAFDLTNNNAAVLQKVTRYDRSDVANALKMAGGGVGLGFRISTRITSIRELSLNLRLAFGVSTVIEGKAIKMYPLELSGILHTSKLLVHAAHIESATYFSNAKQLIVSGWLVAENDADLWVQTDAGHFVCLDQCYRYTRSDIHNAYHEQMGVPVQRAGFIARITQLERAKVVRIMCAEKDSDRVVVESDIVVSHAGKDDSVTQLIHIRTPAVEWRHRIELIDLPFLRALGEKSAVAQHGLVAELTQQNEFEATHIIWIDRENVPLENLALALAKDASFRVSTELIFVFENETLESVFNANLLMLSRLHGLNIRFDAFVVSRSIIDGFNQAARHSKGKVLFFSSAHEIPMGRALTAEICKQHAERPDVAVISPLILNYSGVIESAGMKVHPQPDRFLIRGFSTLGLGVDPKLLSEVDAEDVHSSPFEYLSIKREIYFQLNGFSSRFISFEFSVIDLCKRAQGVGRPIEVSRDLAVVSLRPSRSVSIHEEDGVFRRSSLELLLLVGVEKTSLHCAGA